ncbi:MAG: hypothetical protein LBT10_03720 [Methanobrevibacter sp.]|jgi:hypothetical protein|nr:hypothetical protein [Methanobrevibacter sp.]
MFKKINVLIIVLLIVNLLATGIIFNNDINNHSLNYSKDIKYTLYIGTNDKDTFEPISQAETIVNSICDKYLSGYSYSRWNGFWKNSMNQTTHESTLVYTFYGVSEENITSISNDLIKELNQESILVEKDIVYSTYCYGNKLLITNK